MLQAGEGAEIAEEEYVPISDVVLENFVIVKKNPDYKVETVKPRKKTSMGIYF